MLIVYVVNYEMIYLLVCELIYVYVLVFFFIFLDVNECNSIFINICDFFIQECENIEGSFLCNCKNGYWKVGQVCEGEF